MPDPRRASCVRCGGHKSQVGPISWTGLCQACSIDAVTENMVGIATRTGEPHKRRTRGMIEYLRRELLDAAGER